MTIHPKNGSAFPDDLGASKGHGNTNHFPRHFCLKAFAFALGLSAVLMSPDYRASGAATGTIKESALREISALIAEKDSRTDAQRKLESHLIHATKWRRGEPFAPGVTNLELGVKIRPDGRVLVDIRASVTPELLALIQAGGGEVINSVPQFNAIRALVTLDQLETLGASKDVRFIRRAVEGHTHTGSIDSQGDATHGAMSARTTFGVSGAGVKVGVISDSVDYYTNSQATGDLGALTILSGQGNLGDPKAKGEGTAMLEIVHDLAPGADLYFASGFITEAQFAQNILNLYSNGCLVIVDDISYYDESPFQDGIVARAVNTVTSAGALYFSSAANSGNKDSGQSGTWEGDFVDGGDTTTPLPSSRRIHSFAGTNYDTVTTGVSNRVDLFWSDPLGASTNDYDLYILDTNGSTVLRLSNDSQNGTQDPYESVELLNQGERIVIIKYRGADRFLHVNTLHAQLAISTCGATVGHSATTNAFSVAAVDVQGIYPGLFTGGSANSVEKFSSDGPRRVFYHADGTPITPGNFSSTGGAVRLKPDLAAADGVSTTVTGFKPFYGTSAAAPHAAAIAALLKSYKPSLTPGQVRSILTSTALDIGASGWDRDSGYGIVMANQALQAADSGIWARPSFVAGSLKYVSQGQFQFTLAGTSGTTNEIQVSTNLTNWSVLGKIVMTNSTADYLDSPVPSPRRFYRARLLQ